MSERCGAVALTGRPLTPPPRPDAERPVRHLYVHVPFCARRCSYCDFSIAVRRETPVAEYIEALQHELQQYKGTNVVLDTVYLGGGTPSRLGGKGIVQLLRTVRDVAEIANGAEITIEANPDDVSLEVARQWVDAGITRLSLGVQSFDERVLQWMHRTHTAEQSLHAVTAARAAGIKNISADLIFALPEELQRNWKRDIDQLITLNVEHISLYGLTVEPGTPLGRWNARGEVAEPPDQTYEAEFLLAHQLLSQAGFEHYEVSNYARPNYYSRHNTAYWTGAPYAGVGPSSHSFTGTHRTWNVAPYAEWIKCLARGEPPVEGFEELTPENRAIERIYLGLRTNRGLQATDTELAKAQLWLPQGWAQITGRTIVLTPSGWLRLDPLATSLTLAGTA